MDEIESGIRPFSQCIRLKNHFRQYVLLPTRSRFERTTLDVSIPRESASRTVRFTDQPEMRDRCPPFGQCVSSANALLLSNARTNSAGE